MEKNKTAVEWLAIEIYENFEMKGDGKLFNKIFNKAKEMEKQQIIDATIYGNRQEFYDGEEIIGEQYYNETYKKPRLNNRGN